MKNLILKDWGWIRFARLVFALYLILKAYTVGENIYYFIGAFLLYQAVFNIKCITGTCNDATCEANNNDNK